MIKTRNPETEESLLVIGYFGGNLLLEQLELLGKKIFSVTVDESS